MLDRTRLGISVYELAEQFNISQTSVKKIITSYLGYCKEQILEGNRVDFFGLVSLVPELDEPITQFSSTLAYNCREVAHRLGLSEYAVYSIMKAYIDLAIDHIKAGTTVELRGLVVVTPLKEDGKLTKVHSSISQTIRGILDSQETKVKRVRVHTSKDLRVAIQEGDYAVV